MLAWAINVWDCSRIITVWYSYPSTFRYLILIMANKLNWYLTGINSSRSSASRRGTHLRSRSRISGRSIHSPRRHRGEHIASRSKSEQEQKECNAEPYYNYRLIKIVTVTVLSNTTLRLFVVWLPFLLAARCYWSFYKCWCTSWLDYRYDDWQRLTTTQTCDD